MDDGRYTPYTNIFPYRLEMRSAKPCDTNECFPIFDVHLLTLTSLANTSMYLIYAIRW